MGYKDKLLKSFGISRRRRGDKRLIAELSPGKKGGDFELPFGGYLSIQPGTMSKRDVVSCCMVSPSDRYKYLPPIRSNEHIVSEIYLLVTSLKSWKKPLHLSLPHYPENMELFDLVVLRRSTEEEAEWMQQDFHSSEAGRFVEIQTEKDGIYVVTSQPRQERFTVPINGCLFNSRLSKQISVRFPKKATDTELQCTIQITPLNKDNLPNLRRDFPKDMCDLVLASDFYEIRPNIQQEFKRPITVKLPLLSMEKDDLPQSDLAVVEETVDGWKVVGAALKFTRTAVSFDVRTLSRYCVTLARPDRKWRLPEAFRRIHGENDVTRGEILPFLHIQEKLWTVWFDCVPNENVQECISKRQKQGFRHIKQSEVKTEDEQMEQESSMIRRSWRSRQRPKVLNEEEKSQRTDLDLLPGKVFELDVGGDLQLSEDDKGSTYMGLQYNDRLPENYRRFFVEPAPLEEGKEVTGIIKIFSEEEDRGTKKRKCVRTFDFDIDREAVAAYYYIEPEPEPEPEPDPKPEVEPEIESLPALSPPPPSPKQVMKRPMTASFMRLTKPSRPPRIVTKESKVLSGRSLMCLAREVEQGLTLAIYLDISDSTITGMGFDALANGLSLVDITYRILLLWKRRSSKYKDRQVEMLADALQEMGRDDMATVILERHRQNLELTQECFELAMGAE